MQFATRPPEFGELAAVVALAGVMQRPLQ